LAKNVNANYFIGQVNKPIDLKKYFLIQPGSVLAKAEVNETNGALPRDVYFIDNSELTFNIYLTDRTFDGIIATFKLCVFLSSLESDCNLELSIHVFAASAA
jgi:hypothetical protein